MVQVACFSKIGTFKTSFIVTIIPSDDYSNYIILYTVYSVLTFELLSSIYCSFFFFYFQSFTGNEDRNSEVKHILYEGVFARYLQFLPETHQGAVCLRTELFGVKLKPGEY